MKTNKILITLLTMLVAHSAHAAFNCDLVEINFNQNPWMVNESFNSERKNSQFFPEVEIIVTEFKSGELSIDAMQGKKAYMGSAIGYQEVTLKLFIDRSDDSRQLVITCKKK